MNDGIPPAGVPGQPGRRVREPSPADAITPTAALAVLIAGPPPPFRPEALDGPIQLALAAGAITI